MPESRTVGKAITIYLEVAYPNGVPARIAALVGGLNGSSRDILQNSAFSPEQGDQCKTYALRLGCAHYPHMKLKVAIWPSGLGCFFRVDGHDKHILVPPGHPEHAAMEELRRKNQFLVDSIERAWSEAGIPTYEFCFNEEIKQLLARDQGL